MWANGGPLEVSGKAGNHLSTDRWCWISGLSSVWPVCTTSEFWLCGLSRGSLSIFGSVGVVPLIRIWKGVIIDSPRKEMRPRELTLIPDEIFELPLFSNLVNIALLELRWDQVLYFNLAFLHWRKGHLHMEMKIHFLDHSYLANAPPSLLPPLSSWIG